MATVGPTSSMVQPAVPTGPTLPAASVGVTASVWMPLLVTVDVWVEPAVLALQANGAPLSTRQVKVSLASPAMNLMSGAFAALTGVMGTPVKVTAGGGVRSTLQGNDASRLARAPVRVPTTEKLCAPSVRAR